MFCELYLNFKRKKISYDPFWTLKKKERKRKGTNKYTNCDIQVSYNS